MTPSQERRVEKEVLSCEERDDVRGEEDLPGSSVHPSPSLARASPFPLRLCLGGLEW